ncbi:MAG: iron ABC transporter permease, partial [Nostocoides sp.]
MPIGYLLVRTGSAGPERIAAVLLRGRTAELLARSLAFATAVTALSLLLGCALALLVARSDLPGRRVLAVLAPLPLAVPSYVAAFAWISYFPGLAGPVGAVLVLTLCCYPYVYLPVLAVLRQSDPATEEVARSLGRRPWAALREVT